MICDDDLKAKTELLRFELVIPVCITIYYLFREKEWGLLPDGYHGRDRFNLEMDEGADRYADNLGDVD